MLPVQWYSLSLKALIDGASVMSDDGLSHNSVSRTSNAAGLRVRWIGFELVSTKVVGPWKSSFVNKGPDYSNPEHVM